MEDPETSITRTPKWGKLVDGQGKEFMITMARQVQDGSGEESVELFLVTNPEVEKVYNLRVGYELSQQHVYKLRAKKIDLIGLNTYDAGNLVFLYQPTLMGGDTELTKLQETYKSRLKAMEKRVAILQAQNIYLVEQNKMALSNPEKYLSLGAKVYEQAVGGISQIMGRNQEEKKNG